MSFKHAALVCSLVFALESVAASAPADSASVCSRVAYLLNDAPEARIPFVEQHSLEAMPDAWRADPAFAYERSNDYSVARIHAFGRTLNEVTRDSGGTCGSLVLSLWTDDFSQRFSRWAPLEAEEDYGFGEWLFEIDDTPYLYLADGLAGDFRVLRIERDGDAVPVCDGKRLLLTRDRAPLGGSDPICAAEIRGETHSLPVESPSNPLPLTGAPSFGADLDHANISARMTVDIDNDGVPERVGLARYFIDTAGCGNPNDVPWPQLLDESGEHAVDTPANRALTEAMGVENYDRGMQATTRLVEFRGVRYIEQRALSTSAESLHKVFRLDGDRVSTVCDFQPRRQYEVSPVGEGG